METVISNIEQTRERALTHFLYIEKMGVNKSNVMNQIYNNLPEDLQYTINNIIQNDKGVTILEAYNYWKKYERLYKIYEHMISYYRNTNYYLELYRNLERKSFEEQDYVDLLKYYYVCQSMINDTLKRKKTLKKTGFNSIDELITYLKENMKKIYMVNRCKKVFDSENSLIGEHIGCVNTFVEDLIFFNKLNKEMDTHLALTYVMFSLE